MNTDGASQQGQKHRQSARNQAYALRQGTKGIKETCRADIPDSQEKSCFQPRVQHLDWQQPAEESTFHHVHLRSPTGCSYLHPEHNPNWRSGSAMFVPGHKVEVLGPTGDMSAYQIRSPTTNLPQGVVMSSSPGSAHSPQQLAEEATRKRELRLMKNREAAKECRRRKREYINCLEARNNMLELQNKKLIDELQYLKETYAEKSSSG